MKLLNTKWLLVAVIACTAGNVSADPDATGVEKFAEPSISFDAAVNIAVSTTQGKMVAMEIDHHAASSIYLAEIQKDKSILKLRIDGSSGDVLSTTETTGKSFEEAHARHEQQAHSHGIN